MAKPILLVRIDKNYFVQSQLDALLAQIKNQGIDSEYFVICTSVGCPKENFTFEVFSGENEFNTSATVKGKDIIFTIDRTDKS